MASTESSRVVRQPDEETSASVDATIRFWANGVRVIADGEGANPVDALENGLSAAPAKAAAAGCTNTSATCSTCARAQGSPLPAFTDGIPVRVTAVHEPATVSGLAFQFGAHEVDRFSYARDRSGRADVTLWARGGARQAQRVGAKLRRIVGVLAVVVDDNCVTADLQQDYRPSAAQLG